MWIYILLLLIPVFAFFSLGRKGAKSVSFLTVYLSILAIFVGLGDMLGGYDRYIYSHYFDSLADYLKSGDGLFSPRIIAMGYRTEMGYVLWNFLLAHITANRYIFIFLTTLLIYFLLFQSFKKYTENYPFAMILFMGLWFAFTFTYLRQVLAASIGFLSIRYIIDRKLWKFLLVVVIAMSFHNSAIILLPFYFLPQKKYSKNAVLVLMFVCLVLGLTNVTTSLYSVYGDVTEDVGRLSRYDAEGSFRIAYFLEAVFVLFFLLRKYETFKADDRKQIVLVNMALCFCAILLFFIRSENGGRMSWFYMLGVISTLSYLVAQRPIKSDVSLTLIGVSVLLYLRIIMLWGPMLSPYKTFLTNGERPEYVDSQMFEYDHNYGKDKFYR